MARVALLNASDGSATAVRAVLGVEAVIACRKGSVPPDAVLLIAELGATDVVSPAALGLPDSGAPLLLLTDGSAVIDPGAFGTRHVRTLRKPFQLIDLRTQIRALLDSILPAGRVADAPAATPATAAPLLHPSPSSGDPGRGVDSQARMATWLGPARVAAEAVCTLAAACRLDGAVWIVGEAGTGADHVAAALARAWDPDREPVVWPESDSLAATVARLGDSGRVLWVPALEDRPLQEQRAFERYLLLEPARRVAVTSADDPAAAVAAGTLLRSLHHALARVSLRLAPLRERRGEIAALAVSIGNEVASSAFGAECVVFSEEARRTLESYPWPGNLTELDAAVTRSVIARAAKGVRSVGLGAEHLRFAPQHLLLEDLATSSLGEAAIPAAEPALPPRRAVVVSLGSTATVRAARPSDATSPEPTQVAGSPGDSPPVEVAHEGVEGVLAAFAHDIRNPMSTIKTFAGLQAALAGDETAELARLAVEACERIDEHLELLQRYAELPPRAPTLVDIVDTLGEAVDAAGGGASLAIMARRSLWVRTDAALARFVADIVVAECRSRVEPAGADAQAVAASADIAAPAAGTAADTTAIEIRIPVGAAVDRLDKWVEGASLPWRLALAREAARRGGGDLQVEVEDGQMRVNWRLPRGEEGKDDNQAGSPDHRRRSGSS